MKFFNLEPAVDGDGNKVLDVSLFGEIDPGFFGDGVASKEIAAMLGEHMDAKRITVRINSVGGDLFGGLSIYNLLRAHGGEVTTIVEGLAASAASIVAMAGHTVMGKGAMMMVHNPMMFTFGDAEDHRQQAAVLDKARDSLLSVYKEKTGKTTAQLKKMLDAETWLTAEEAKREGFADEIADKPIKARASADAVVLNSISFLRSSVPASILAVAERSTPTPRKGKDTTMEITRELLAEKNPTLLQALLDEGKAQGVAEGEKSGYAKGETAERARMKAIDELGVRGYTDLVASAKYGDAPMDARDLAVAALKASQAAGDDMLAARRVESKEVASVRQPAPGDAQSEEERAREFMKSYARSLAARNGRK